MKKHESIRIFKNPLLESLTHVHPITPLLLWGPIVGYWIYQAFTVDMIEVTTFVWMGIFALVVWTFTEYFLHRFVFHFPAKNRFTKRFVFLFHGLHHDDPQDPTRLVMPPFPAILIMTCLWYFFALFVPSHLMNTFMAFFTIGYLCYDYIHYATHHFPMTSKVGRYLRKFHLQHHFRHEKAKYGVSSPLWDIIFRTMTGPKEESH